MAGNQPPSGAQTLPAQVERLLAVAALPEKVMLLLDAIQFGHPAATLLLGELSLPAGSLVQPVQVQLTVTRIEDAFIG